MTVAGIVIRLTGVSSGYGAAFLVLAGFLAAFLFIRTSARLMRSPKVPWWPGSVVTEGGMHIHHVVFGVVILLIAGFVGIATPISAPWWEITAVMFGVGAGLVLDEFALLLHLDDVYWSREGRSSIDAVLISAAFGALVAVGTRPFGLDSAADIGGTVVTIVVVLAVAAVAFLKGRTVLGVISLFVLPVGIVAAVRLARPGSPWAHWFYTGRREARLTRASARFDPRRRGARFGDRLRDVIGGEISR